MRLTLEKVKREIAHIEAIKGDYEAAHGKEDWLHQLVLEAIAEGHPQAKELAAAALETRDIEFSRYCA